MLVNSQLVCLLPVGVFNHVKIRLHYSFHHLVSLALKVLLLGTFRSEDEDEYQYEFSVLSMRIRFGDRQFLKCACSEQKTRTRSRPRPPI